MLTKNNIRLFGEYLEKKAFVGSLVRAAGKAFMPTMHAMTTSSAIKSGVGVSKLTRPGMRSSASRVAFSRLGRNPIKNIANSAGSFYR